MDVPLKITSISEITAVINSLKRKKSPGYDLITTNILLQLPTGVIDLDQWKIAEIIMISKPGKHAKFVDSYRPLSLLSSLSKILEIIFLSRLLPVVEERKLIPSHQLGFRWLHGTVEQIQR